MIEKFEKMPEGHTNSKSTPSRPRTAAALVVGSTLLGLMGTDLVLPAVPSLPARLGGDAAQAQLVLAAYVGGTGVGLLGFGALGDRCSTRSLFIASLLATALISFACAFAPGIGPLIILRALQGAASAGPVVFAAAIVRILFDESRAIRAIGVLGSIESLAPALAPLLGIWLLAVGGWTLSFRLIGAIALLLAAANLALPLIPQTSRRPSGSYRRLVADPVFLRYALSHACVLGGLLVFVFGAPTVFVHSLGADLGDFILLQMAGVATFILAANSTTRLIARFGPERVIGGGTAFAALGGLGLLLYALAGGTSTLIITLLYLPVNSGLGFRGPPGFYRAILAAQGDDARGGALVVLAIMAVAGLGTAAVAPFITRGLIPLGIGVCAMELLALAALALLPRLDEA